MITGTTAYGRQSLAEYLHQQNTGLRAEIQQLLVRSAALEWLEKQAIISSPDLLWISGATTLVEAVHERIALEEMERRKAEANDTH